MMFVSEIIIIVAIAKNYVIGNKGQIPWHISEDFKHFKELTLNHPIIMGKNTFISLPIKPLPKRENIVLTYKDDDFNNKDVIIKHSLKDAIDYCKLKDQDVYVIGGGFVYKQAMEFATKLEITKIDKEYVGDTFFPKIDDNIWKIIKEEKKDGFSFLTYIRK